MEIYLPIAEMSVQWPVIIGLGMMVGVLSGMFGVGGGFLLTPLLMFYGIPPTVAVGTVLSHATGSAASGALVQWRRHTIDFALTGVMLVGGLTGTAFGVWVFTQLRQQGQTDLVISLAYVLLLGGVGAIMLRESLSSLHTTGAAPVRIRTVSRGWMARLPLKVRFRQSRIYISIIPPMGLGFAIGMMGAIMGVAGSFVMIPAMIYLLRMPTNVVMGTTLFQITITTAIATVLQATSNYTVDIVLSGLLIVGGVVGAQLGVQIGSRLKGEQLRLLLALVVLTVCVGMLWDLVARPADLFSLAMELQ
jgi:uncharacterized membrane protein YfcA